MSEHDTGRSTNARGPLLVAGAVALALGTTMEPPVSFLVLVAAILAFLVVILLSVVAALGAR